jgi:transcription initiation factor TFIID subunit TAF12
MTGYAQSSLKSALRLGSSANVSTSSTNNLSLRTTTSRSNLPPARTLGGYLPLLIIQRHQKYRRQQQQQIQQLQLQQQPPVVQHNLTFKTQMKLSSSGVGGGGGATTTTASGQTLVGIIYFYKRLN